MQPSDVVVKAHNFESGMHCRHVVVKVANSVRLRNVNVPKHRFLNDLLGANVKKVRLTKIGSEASYSLTEPQIQQND